MQRTRIFLTVLLAGAASASGAAVSGAGRGPRERTPLAPPR